MMVYGIPGCGKSTFTQWYVDSMGCSALYFSADTDAHDAISRLAAKRLHWPTDHVVQAIEAGGLDFINGELEASRVQFCFDSSPTLSDIAEELDAYVEVWDAYPDVVIVDNLLNVESESTDEHQGLRWIMKEMHHLARETGSTVIVIHHAREENSNPGMPPSRQTIQGKVSQLPEIILSVALDDRFFRIAPVKVRSGKSDPSGNTYISLVAQPEMASFGRSYWT